MASRTLLLVLAAVMLAGCQNVRETTGAVGGAVLGGYAGSKVGGGSGKTIATAVGAALGMLAGAEVGRRLDEHARMTAEAATVRALNTARAGEAGIVWEAPNASGEGGPVQGRIDVLRDGNRSGAPCREFVQTIRIGGEETEARGIACRDAAGEWVIES